MKKFLFRTIFSGFLLAAGGSLLAATPTSSITPTATPSMSPTSSATPTVTPAIGQGSYTVNPAAFGDGSRGNSLELDFLVGPAAMGQGVLRFAVPDGFDNPNPNNFYISPAQAVFQSSAGYSGLTYTTQLKNVPSGTLLKFFYGFNPSGFAINQAAGSTSFRGSSAANTLDLSVAGPVAVQPTVLVFTQTSTATTTVTFTPTISPTFSPSPTITPTFTESPVAATEASPFTYPNPFDLRRFNKVTFLFPYDTGVEIEIFNLAGEPVVKLIRADAANRTPDGKGGWAIWDGHDDHGHLASGGLYFYRLKGSSRTWTGKMTVIH